MTTGRKRLISAFVVAWLLVFYYESMRHFYLEPWLGVRLPKLKFLFPPAGWIMFYRVDDSDGRAEVYGLKGDQLVQIDPHSIFQDRWVGYDNIRRNVLITALDPNYGASFCRFLAWKVPGYDGYAVVEAWTPSVSKEPEKQLRRVAYRC